MNISSGQPAPNFTLPDQNGDMHELSSYEGKTVVLYFYPKDATSGCTVEAQAFRDAYTELAEKNVAVLGVSADSVQSHKDFHESEDLNFDILADPQKRVIEQYDSLSEDGEMAERNTFLIGPDGVVQEVYEGVDPETHLEELWSDIA